jgi:hypothetical protein
MRGKDNQIWMTTTYLDSRMRWNDIEFREQLEFTSKSKHRVLSQEQSTEKGIFNPLSPPILGDC